MRAHTTFLESTKYYSSRVVATLLDWKIVKRIILKKGITSKLCHVWLIPATCHIPLTSQTFLVSMFFEKNQIVKIKWHRTKTAENQKLENYKSSLIWLLWRYSVFVINLLTEYRTNRYMEHSIQSDC